MPFLAAIPAIAGSIAGAIGSAAGAVGSAVAGAAGGAASAIGSAASAAGGALAGAAGGAAGGAGAAAGGAASGSAGAAGGAAGAAAGAGAGAAGAGGATGAGAGAAGAAGGAAGGAPAAITTVPSVAAGTGGAAMTPAAAGTVTAAPIASPAAAAPTVVAPAGTGGLAATPLSGAGGAQAGALSAPATAPSAATPGGLTGFLQQHPMLQQILKQQLGGQGGGDDGDQSMRKRVGRGLTEGLQSGGQDLQNRQPAAPGLNIDPMNALAQLVAMGQMKGYADGGQMSAGETGVVGEQGPELATSLPGGGTQITPMQSQGPQPLPGPPEPQPQGGSGVATPPAGEGLPRQALDMALRTFIGTFDPSVLARHDAAVGAHQKFLATAALQHPQLLRSSGDAVAAVDGLLGAGTSARLVQEGDPNSNAKALADAYGIPIYQRGTPLSDGSTAGSELSQLNAALGRQGQGVTVTSKGEIRISSPSRPTEQSDQIKATSYFNQLQQAAMGAGFSDVEADQIAARRLTQVAPGLGITVPKVYQDLAMATTQTDIEGKRAAVKTFNEQTQQLQFEGPKAFARESATRRARMDTPISADETRANSARLAQQFGGTVYGRAMKDDDLVSAESSNMVLKQQPDGTYVGIPKDSVPNDAQVLYPSELLTKRLAQKIALKRTSQQENANIVISALDDIDHLHATDLLVPASPAQGPGLGSAVASAVGTEIAGQTTGRLTLFAMRRSTDAGQREKAAALINLANIANSVVKATGDSGNISDADRRIAFQALGRVTSGVASREEAQEMLQKVRRMMVELNAGVLDKDRAHAILTGGAPNPHEPPPGFTAVPGTGAFYRVVPAQPQAAQ